MTGRNNIEASRIETKYIVRFAKVICPLYDFSTNLDENSLLISIINIFISRWFINFVGLEGVKVKKRLN